VSFAGADCANFASQCARAGDMPQSRGTTAGGWWYDKEGTSSPWDDTYSLSWINCTRQIGYWNTRRTDWETSAGVLSRGDFIYYDWSGDGVWDHVAVVAGTNSAGQKVIDAHTTDHYRVYWKLGYSGTKYRYAKVRPQWVV
jgi:cell wall-associated NlpC family hydrolase